MKDRIIAAVVRAVIHNKKTTVAALVAVLGLAAAKLGLHVSPDALVYVAGFIVLVIGAAAGDTHRRLPK